MATMNISLPETLREFVDQQVARAGYGSVSDYARELIRRDQERQAERHLAGLIREGLESGAARPVEARYLGRQARQAPDRGVEETGQSVKPVRVRPLADADIDTASGYLRRNGPEAASRLLAALERAFRELARHPGAGSPRYAHVLPAEGLRMDNHD